MGSLQYYFFPTDFYYPRAKSVNGDNAGKPVLHVQPPNADADNLEKCKAALHSDGRDNNMKLYYEAPSSTALVPFPCIIKTELRRRKRFSSVADCSNN
ncbi:hypothetical protein FH972_016740 [Carpinus fangiana]|uniref:Uncharacterized protein n=1 Tax=Carpinus fangiana TaxID=176857 RepID=A0A5N6RK39_9ROSI|nr:hypothetical protein FH972_016740 [Carpinus fangiana]